MTRCTALAAALVLGLPGVSHAQALGTMQVSARVLPADAAWTGLAESRLAARSLVAQPAPLDHTRPVVRRNGTVLTRAQVIRRAGQPLLLVTVQHPHN